MDQRCGWTLGCWNSAGYSSDGSLPAGGSATTDAGWTKDVAGRKNVGMSLDGVTEADSGAGTGNDSNQNRGLDVSFCLRSD